MKQTAVEYLLSYLPQIDYGNDPYYDEIINKAKEMEKEQIIDAYEEGFFDERKGRCIDAEKHYNETFNK